jgi:hypothetical protein
MNKLLGELEIELGGKKYVLKPTFEALQLMEDKSGRTLSQLVRVFLTSNAGIKDVAAVVYGGLYGANGNKSAGIPKYEDVGELIMNDGAVNLFGPCGMLVGCAYSGKTIDEAVKTREDVKAARLGEDLGKNGQAVPDPSPGPSAN